MPTKLSTTVGKIKMLSKKKNSHMILEFQEFMKESGASERHQNNNLKIIYHFHSFLALGI
jgi:hypothetical protein